MNNHSPTIKFGITTDGKRSSYWRLRAGVKQPELFLEREAYGKKWHFSLHASGQWHMKESGKTQVTWTRPAEVAPGYTRAVGIVEPIVAAHRKDPAPQEVVLVPVALETQMSTVFSIFIERPGANLNDSWPGRNADHSTFIGRIPLATGGGTCVVVASQAPLQPGRVEMPRPSDDELRQMREWAVNGVLVTTIVGEFTDGAIALIDLCADPSVVATIDGALS
ncbi:hypothetical protein ACQPZX_01870 [Actinoplanes sp. CA-142083]|uniref:hypothetical protein n=1 Tax=Actinoplanes sp. CA-142083 TaxID=3239903 RepID=UPI003D8D3A30